jgi:hypothetical protein
VLELPYGSEELCHFRATEDDRQAFTTLLTNDPVENPVLTESHLIEELQGTADLVVQTGRGAPLLDEMDEIATDFLRRELVGGLVIILSQLGHGPDVRLLGVG